MRYAWVIALAAACGGEKSEPPAPTTASPSPAPSTPAPPPVDAAPPPATVPTVKVDRVAFGACAPEGTAFESGPKPARFDPLLLGRGMGPGDATIGVGQIGTLGHGYGGTSFAGRRVRVPSVVLGQPVVEGDLDKAIIRRYLKRNLAKLSFCYERELAENSKLEGEVKTSFVITAIGAVQDVKASGVDPKVADCVRGVLSAIQFPASKNGGVVKVQYPFKFRPPEQVEIAVDATPYVPDERNPLRPHATAMGACFTKLYGVGLVELGTDVKVHGLDDQPAACIAKIAAQVADKANQTCAFAWGTMPVDALPAIEVDTAIRWNGKELAPARADADLMPLAEAIRAARPAGDIPIVGPIVIRPAAKAPKDLAARIATSLRVLDIDALVATPSGDSWKLPVPIELPVVPVPVGTGTSWTEATRRK